MYVYVYAFPYTTHLPSHPSSSYSPLSPAPPSLVIGITSVRWSMSRVGKEIFKKENILCREGREAFGNQFLPINGRVSITDKFAPSLSVPTSFPDHSHTTASHAVYHRHICFLNFYHPKLGLLSSSKYSRDPGFIIWPKSITVTQIWLLYYWSHIWSRLTIKVEKTKRWFRCDEYGRTYQRICYRGGNPKLKLPC